ncbi:MAG: Uncharacterised protein [SAR116 cluster bacterium]|nr:MAG: Uncharacterised protein [SAR116 cluster bacterium]
MKIGQHLGIQPVAQYLDKARRMLTGQSFYQICLVCRVQRCHQRLHTRFGIRFDGCDDSAFHLWCQTIERSKAVAFITAVDRFSRNRDAR